jgi:hypothetical protein
MTFHKGIVGVRSAIACIIIVASACCVPGRGLAQQAYPMLMSIEPVAAQVGQTTEHTLKSRYSMDGAYRVLVSGEGVTGEVVPHTGSEPPKLPQQSLQVKFTVAPDALPGVRDVRIATPRGVSTVAQLVIAHDPIFKEPADNDLPVTAPTVTLPATLCGRLEKAEDVDLYKFSAKGGESFCFVVRCMSLQDRIHDLQNHADPILTLRSANGATLAASDNVFGADPFLCHTFAADGDYLLEIRDVRYTGNEHWQYSIEVAARPFVRTVFPLAFSPEAAAHAAAPIGAGLAEGLVAKVEFPNSIPSGVRTLRVKLDGQKDASVSGVIDAGPFETESAAPNETADAAQSVALPAGIQGVIDRPSDVDCFAFDAKKGDAFSFEIFARRAGSALDSHLRLLDATGKQIQLNDDLRDGKRNYPDSRIENWTAPADGKYVLEVRDLNLRGGKEFIYFLKTIRATPDFKLFTDTDKTLLTPGTSGVIYVRAERKNGFDGEIQLQVDGLPPGVTATAGKIMGGAHVDGCIVLTADASAKPDAGNIQIRGVAQVKDSSGQSHEQVVAAAIYQEIYQPGGGRGHWPVESHTVSIGAPGDILEVKVGQQEVTLKPGSTVTLDIEIKRAPGFDKNVLLEVQYMHLSSIFGDSLPKGVTVDGASSTTLLTGGASQGKITLKAAADTKPAERQVFAVMANVSLNFVMKATYASSPLVITIAP